MTDVARTATAVPRLDDATRAALLDGRHGEPHQVLGPHSATVGGTLGVVIRVFQPDAADAFVLREGVATAMRADGDGFFTMFLPAAPLPLRYTLRFLATDGRSWERGDPYRFEPTVGEMDL